MPILIHGAGVNPETFDPAGSAATVDGKLAAHAGKRDNPHGVTAAQAGADPAGSAAAVDGKLAAHAGKRDNPHGVTAAQVGAAAASHTHTAAQVGAPTVAEFNTLKTSVSEGKALVAAAVTDKGVSTAAGAAWATIAANIRGINTGGVMHHEAIYREGSTGVNNNFKKKIYAGDIYCPANTSVLIYTTLVKINNTTVDPAISINNSPTFLLIRDVNNTWKMYIMAFTGRNTGIEIYQNNTTTITITQIGNQCKFSFTEHELENYYTGGSMAYAWTQYWYA